MGTIFERLKSYDIYGMEFSLNYRGEETFKTHHGGFFSILVVLFVLNYTGANMTRMLNKEHPDFYNHYMPLTDEDRENVGIIPLSEYRFNIALQFRKDGKLVEKIPENIAKIRAYMMTEGE